LSSLKAKQIVVVRFNLPLFRWETYLFEINKQIDIENKSEFSQFLWSVPGYSWTGLFNLHFGVMRAFRKYNALKKKLTENAINKNKEC
jgi:hypothetical protein